MKPTERVVVYGSLGLRKGISDLLWAFRKSNRMEEFPAYLDDHPFQVMDRVRNEIKAGLRTADVVLMPHYAVQTLGMEGLLSHFHPSAAAKIPQESVGIANGAIPIGVTFMAMAYNTEALRRSDLPDSLSGFSDKSWHGSLGTQSLTASRAGNLGVWYFSFLRQRMGSRAWRKFVDSLSEENRPVAYDCIDHLLQGLLGGEVKLALTVYSLAYFREKTAGSPVALVESERVPHMMTFTSSALLKGSEDSSPAKRFMEFLLTPEAQQIIGGIPGIAPVRREVKPAYDFEHPLGERTEFHPAGKDFEELASTLRLLKELKLP